MPIFGKQVYWIFQSDDILSETPGTYCKSTSENNASILRCPKILFVLSIYTFIFLRHLGKADLFCPGLTGVICDVIILPVF